jgi:hypothetical protein
MNFKRTLQILSKDIEEIEKILDEIDISSPAGRMEMKLAISKLKNLRENFGMFGDLLGEPAAVPAPPAAAPAPAPPEKAPPAGAAPLSSPAGGDEEKEKMAPEEVQEKTENKEPVAGKKEEPAPVQEEAPAESPAEEPERSSAKKNSKGKQVRLSDTLHASHEYRNEQLARGQSGEDLSSRLSKSAVSDLRKIINLNEKFMFIRDLFDGDKVRYEETLRTLNEATSRRQAEEFLASFRWDKKNQAARRFLELAQRKLKSLKDG